MAEEGSTLPSTLIAELLSRCTFPPRGRPLACAVSGGADSLALLVLAAAAGCAVTAIHVDHGLRAGLGGRGRGGAGGGGAVRRARSRATGSSVAAGPNLEARARAARFAVLPADVATGHTMDDQAETILVNLLRGAGADGLAGMEPGARHPLLGLRRRETHALCAAVGLAPVCDASNDDPAFVRNRVRHELLPLCAEVAGRDPVPLLARQAGVLRDEVALLDSLAAEAAARPRRRPGGGRGPSRPLAAPGPAALVAARPATASTRRRWPRSTAPWPSPPARRWGRSWRGAGGCAGPAAGSGSSRDDAPVVSRR